LVYLAEGPNLSIFDVSTPESPRRTGKALAPAVLTDIHVSGGLAAANVVDTGVCLFDVDNPDSPRLITSVKPLGSCHIEDNRLLIASTSSLCIVGIANPYSPIQLATQPMTSSAEDIYAHGSLV
jgi:hypothetical protein